MTYIHDLIEQLPFSWFGIAAIIGGTCWIIKGGTILITGNQPPIVFEAAQFFFLFGLLGIDRLLLVENRIRHSGIRLVYLGIVSILILGIYLALFSNSNPNSDELDFPSLLQVIIALSWFLGTLCLGWVTHNSENELGKWSILPLLMGLSAPIMLIVGGVLAAINERLLELPLLIYAFGWLLLGYLMLGIAKDNQAILT